MPGPKLPDGKTCGDCVHLRRCRAFGFTSSPENAQCDFSPSRFVPTNESVARDRGSAVKRHELTDRPRVWCSKCGSALVTNPGEICSTCGPKALRERREWLSELADARGEIAVLACERDRLRETDELTVSQRDQARAEAAHLRDAVRSRDAEIAGLTRRIAELERELREVSRGR